MVEPPITSSSSRGHSGVVVTHTQKVDPKPEEWKKGSLSMNIGLSHRFVEAEQNAAGWPSWLTTVAGESIHGWVPLKTESFEKLDKVCSFLFSLLIQSPMYVYVVLEFDVIKCIYVQSLIRIYGMCDF